MSAFLAHEILLHISSGQLLILRFPWWFHRAAFGFLKCCRVKAGLEKMLNRDKIVP
jgi:hypothetical protein